MVFNLVVITRYYLQDALMEAGSFMHWGYFAAIEILAKKNSRFGRMQDRFDLIVLPSKIASTTMGSMGLYRFKY